MKLNHVAGSNPSEITENMPADTLDDLRTNPNANFTETSRNSCVQYNPKWVQPTHVAKYRHETYKSNKKNRADQQRKVTDLTMIRRMSERFSKVVDYRDYRPVKKLSWYKDDVMDELNKMNKKNAAQMTDRSFYGKDPCRL